MTRTFDPRTKLLLLLLSVFILSLQIDLRTEIIITIIYILPFFITGHYRGGIVFLIIYTAQLITAFYILPHINNTFILYSLSFMANGLRRMMPSITMGTYALSTTTVSEWIAAFKKWHFPNTVIIPLAVIGRFFPTIREDYHQIRNAMAFRGIGSGFISLMKNPIQSLEYIIIPLLMNASQVAQDLTIAALTKGLALPGHHTSIVRLRFSKQDWLYLMIAIFPVLVYLGGMYL